MSDGFKDLGERELPADEWRPSRREAENEDRQMWGAPAEPSRAQARLIRGCFAEMFPDLYVWVPRKAGR